MELSVEVSSALAAQRLDRDVFFMWPAILGITDSNDCGQFPESSLCCCIP